MQRSTICLNMIVKNESGIIERCLDAMVDWIDYWVICDTGSDDGTQDLIKEKLAGIPGELHQTKWVNFGYNRSEAVSLAEGKADYILLCDADMLLKVSDPDWRSKLSCDSYLIEQWHGDYGTRYRNIRLLNGRTTGGKRWCYRGSTHEYCDTIQPGLGTRENFDGIGYLDLDDGGSKADKFERDAKLLSEERDEIRVQIKALEEQDNPSVDLQAQLEHEKFRLKRTLFYLGQTYCYGNMEHAAAIEAFKERIELGGWEEELFYSCLQIGRCYEKLDSWEQAQQYYLRAVEFVPQRAESLLELMRHYNHVGQYHISLIFGEQAIKKPMPDGIFIDVYTYKVQIKDEYALALYYTGNIQKSAEIWKDLVKLDNLDDGNKKRLQANLNFALEKCA